MTRELEAKLVKEAKKVLVFDTITFIKSTKFEIEGQDKTLFLTFGLYNSEVNRLQKLTYEVSKGSIEYQLHMTWL